jgi:hypothetical protein
LSAAGIDSEILRNMTFGEERELLVLMAGLGWQIKNLTNDRDRDALNGSFAWNFILLSVV